jgi:hypothetical protein
VKAESSSGVYPSVKQKASLACAGCGEREGEGERGRHRAGEGGAQSSSTNSVNMLELDHLVVF